MIIYYQHIFASTKVQSFIFILDEADAEDVEDAESEWISNDCLFIACFVVGKVAT